MQKRIKPLLMCLCLILLVFKPLAVSADGSEGGGSVIPFPEGDAGKVIGIAWRADTDSEFYTNIVRAVEEAGGVPVLLEYIKVNT